MNKKKKFKLIVAWSSGASDYASENGFSKLRKNENYKKGYDWDIKEFDSIKEMKAYSEGIDDGGGWDEPTYTEL